MTNAPRNARRAADPIGEILEVEVASANPARRASRTLGFSRRLVAMTVAGAVSATAVFAFAFTARGSDVTELSESLDATVAIPAAAMSAAAESFEDRTEEVSRGAMRSRLSEVVGEKSAQERQATLGASAESATKAQAELSAAERDRLMDEDMKLVAAQSEKLKKEAEEAARKLEEARKLAEAARKVSVGPNAEDGGDMGVMAISDMAPGMAQVVSGLSKGSVSPLLPLGEAKAQVMLIDLEEAEGAADAKPDADTARRIEGILRNPRVQERFQQYTTELRQKALVDIRL